MQKQWIWVGHVNAAAAGNEIGLLASRAEEEAGSLAATVLAAKMPLAPSCRSCRCRLPLWRRLGLHTYRQQRLLQESLQLLILKETALFYFSSGTTSAGG